VNWSAAATCLRPISRNCWPPEPPNGTPS
jgi:hypothetical protein